MSRFEPERCDVVTLPVERRDTFLLMSHGIAISYDDRTIKDALLSNGVRAAEVLVARAAQEFKDPTVDDIAAVAVEIL